MRQTLIFLLLSVSVFTYAQDKKPGDLKSVLLEQLRGPVNLVPDSADIALDIVLPLLDANALVDADDAAQ